MYLKEDNDLDPSEEPRDQKNGLERWSGSFRSQHHWEWRGALPFDCNDNHQPFWNGCEACRNCCNACGVASASRKRSAGHYNCVSECDGHCISVVDVDGRDRSGHWSWCLTSLMPSPFSPAGAGQGRHSHNQDSGTARRSRWAGCGCLEACCAFPHTSVLLFWHREKNLVDFFLLGGRLHFHPMESRLEVSKKLHLMTQVIMCGHECRLLSGAEPADQLVANVPELASASRLSGWHLMRFSNVLASLSGQWAEMTFSIQSNWPLKTLFEQWKQCGTVALLVRRQAWNNLWLKVREHLREQKLESKAGLVGCYASSQLLPIQCEGYLDLTGLLQSVLNCLIWQWWYHTIESA